MKPDSNESINFEQPNSRDLAIKKFETNGSLGVTSEDHRLVGGGAPWDLGKNPGKTFGEIWSIEQLKESLNKQAELLVAARKRFALNQQSLSAMHDVEGLKKDLRANINYLKTIGKLPKEFENFTVEDLPEDPK